MHTPQPEGATRVELYARSELPPPARDQCDRAWETVRRLADRGVLAAVEREEWASRVPLSECGSAVRDTYLSFTAWADEAGVSLTPFFSTRECYGTGEDEPTDFLVFPALCLAVYDDDQLVAVYPHEEAGTVRTVQDGLDALADPVTGVAAETPAAGD